MRYGFYVDPSAQEVFGLAFVPETGKCVQFTDIVDTEQGEQVPAGSIECAASSFRLIIKAHPSNAWHDPVALIRWSGEREDNSKNLDDALNDFGLSVRTLTKKYSEQKNENALRAAIGLMFGNKGVEESVAPRPDFKKAVGCCSTVFGQACAL